LHTLPATDATIGINGRQPLELAGHRATLLTRPGSRSERFFISLSMKKERRPIGLPHFAKLKPRFDKGAGEPSQDARESVQRTGKVVQQELPALRDCS
jgi:hypothetical protein